jgi:hypothetical protein
MKPFLRSLAGGRFAETTTGSVSQFIWRAWFLRIFARAKADTST